MEVRNFDPVDVYGGSFPGETFRVVKAREVDRYGEYRTKRVILEIYDEMAEAMHSGQPYQTRLDPPPADPRVAHPWDPAFGEPPQPGQEWVETTDDRRPPKKHR